MSEKAKKRLNISLTVVFITALALFIITFSIGIPIYCRFFYYIQINTLNLPEKTGWSYAEIREAYDNCLNFCTMPWVEFSTYPLKWSQRGAEHFADCKKLFDLNFWVMLSSVVITLTLLLLNRFKVITFKSFHGRRAYFYSAVVAVALPVLLMLIVLIVGFDRAFEAFHRVFFPGKTNWYIDPMADQIIDIMPEEFFMNCAIIIAVALITFATSLIVTDVVLYKRDKKQETNEQNK